MHITYHGLSCFKIVAKTLGRGSDDVTIILGPYDKSTGLRPLQSKADLVLMPHSGPEFSGVDSLRGDAVVLDMPGEYSVAGVNVVSLDDPADLQDGAERGRATISIIDVEDLKVVYLGALGGEMSPDHIDAATGADILFVPVGDEKGLDGKSAEVLARKIEAKIIIPMHYKTKGIGLNGLRTTDDFCSNIGNCPKEQIEKLIVKSADVGELSMSVVLLKVV